MESKSDEVKKVLKGTKDHYRLLAENASDVIFTLDLNLRYTYCSPSVERLRGYTVEEAMTQTLKDVLTPDSYRAARKALDKGSWPGRERAPGGFHRAANTGAGAYPQRQ